MWRFVSAAGALSIICSGLMLVAGNPSGKGNRHPTRHAKTSLPACAPGELLVKFHESASVSAGLDARGRLNARLRRRLHGGVEQWKLPPGTSIHEAIERLRRRPDVEYAEPNYVRYPTLAPSDGDYPSLWGLHNTGQSGGVPGDDIDAEAAWDITTGSRDVLVAILDTGVSLSHPDLAANIWTNPGEIPGNGIDDDRNGYVDDVHGWDFADDDNDPTDFDRHGTHTTGTIGAVGNNGTGVTGVNWSVSLVPIKLFKPNQGAYDADAAEALDYVARLGVRVTSNSWGGPAYSFTLRDAIQRAADAGVLFVAAAGNEARDIDALPFYPASFKLTNVLSVLATDPSDQLASFSDYGLESVALGAPGVSILSTVPSGYSLLSGTSMATPHVAGVAALLLSVAPGMSPEELKTRLMQTVDPVPSLTNRAAAGGRVNAFQAVSGRDTVAPDPIQDLTATDATSDTISLEWTAVGDDGATGTASSYDLRYALIPLDETTFAGAKRVHQTASPTPPGSRESSVVSGLQPDTTYYLAVEARDEWGNHGPISNLASISTLGPPSFSLSPGALTAELAPGDSVVATATIANTLSGTLDWSIPPPSATRGLDPSGYRFEDSDSPGGPTFAWHDISQTGYAISSLESRDPVSPAISLGFPFPFYGREYESVYVCATGVLSFTNPSCPADPVALPSSSAPDNLIAPFWARLAFHASSGVNFVRDSESFTVQFTDLPTPDSVYTFIGIDDQILLVTFQVTLHRSGEIDFRYLRADDLGKVASIGLQDLTRSNGLSYSYRELSIHDGLAIRFTSVPAIVSATPISGRVEAGDSFELPVQIDASGLDPGRYDRVLPIRSNDSAHPLNVLPVTLFVTGDAPLDLSPATVNFGDVFVRQTARRTVHVTNNGSGIVTLDGMVSVAGVDLQPRTVAIDPGSTTALEITFDPTAPGTLSGSLEFRVNDRHSPDLEIALSGRAVGPPVLAVDAGDLDRTLHPGGREQVTVHLSNAGLSDLRLVLSADRGPSPGTRSLGLPTNGGFEQGDLTGWDLTSTIYPLWEASPAGGGFFGDSQPLEGAFDLLGLLDGYVGDEARLSQWLTLPIFTSPAELVYHERIQFDSFGVPSSQPRSFWAYLLDGNGLLTTIAYESFSLNGSSFMDTGWQRRSFDLSPFSGQTVRLEFLARIPQSFTGPATIELDGLQVVLDDVPQWLAIEPAGPLMIPPGGSRDVSVVFDASDVIQPSHTGAIRIATNLGTDDIVLPASLTVRDAPELVVETTPLDFGRVAVTASASLNLAIENQGTLPLDVTSIMSDDPAFHPGVTSLTVPPAGSAVVQVLFQPGSAGTHEAVLRIISNDPDSPETSVPLLGAGYLPPEIRVQPTAFEVALPPGGRTERTLRITNTGGEILTWDAGGSLPHWISATPPSGSIAPGGTADVMLGLASEGLADGDHSATIHVSSDDPLHPGLELPIVLHVGQVRLTWLSVSPATLNLSSNGKTIRVSIQLPLAYDPHAIVIGSISIDGTLTADPRPVSFGDENGDGIEEITVKFDRASFEAMLAGRSAAVVTITGEVDDTIWFIGTATIRLVGGIMPPGGDPAGHAEGLHRISPTDPAPPPSSPAAERRALRPAL